MSIAPQCFLRFFVAAVLVALSTASFAAAQRSFVSTQGVDAPACPLPAPCRTFTAAIAATAAGGEVIILDSGGYGIVTIDKSVALIAAPGIYAGVSVFSGQDGVTITTPSVNITLRGLEINGQGGNKGIVVNAASVELHVENCVVTGLGSDGMNMNSIGGTLFVRDSSFRDNAGVGVSATSVIASIDHSRIEHNGSDGIAAGWSTWMTVSDSVVVRNAANGIIAYIRLPAGGAITQLTVQRAVVSDNGSNGIDGEATNGASANTVAVSVSGTTVARNQLNGINASSTTPNIAHLAATGNTVEANSIDGIYVDCSGSAASSGVLADNLVTRNLNGISFNGGCGRSLGTSLVRQNVTNDIAGPPPTIVLGN